MTEFKKKLLQTISSSIQRMANPTLQTSLANIGDLPLSGIFYNPFFSGEDILLTLPPNQSGETGFQPTKSKVRDPGLIQYPAGRGVLNSSPRVLNGSPRFCPNATISSAQKSLEWSHTTPPYIQQHKYSIIILYQGEVSQLNICLEVHAIICQIE